MSGRSCLLCGKSLSRIWVGAGEDFCSREHRNQYQLRRGMDRLLEANTVATLARKRETPKLIQQPSRPSASPLSNRGYMDSRQAPPPPATPFAPHFGALAQPHMLDGRGKWLKRSLPKLPNQSRQQPQNGIRFKGGKPSNALPPSQPETSRFESPAAPTRLPLKGVDRESFRTSAALQNTQLRLHLEGALKDWASRPTTAVSRASARKLPVSPPRGYALRVSLGSGFRLPKLRLREWGLGARKTKGLQWRDNPGLRVAPRLGPMKGRATLKAATPKIPKRYKDFPAGAPEAEMHWPEALSIGKIELRRGADLNPKLNGRAVVELLPVTPRPIAQSGWGMPTAEFVAQPRRMAGPSALVRVAAVPFGLAADANGQSSSMEPEGGPNSGRIEERFDSGAKNWIGGIKDWMLDAAGARVGSLALYAPSLEWRDFEMEFLTRIENRSVTWVFRAANGSDYLMATLVALPGKGYAFTRRAVMQGVAGAAVSSPLSILPNPKAAFTVRMQAQGDDFTVWVDGQKIESWTDARMPAGGIGFLGAPDDRARIYWVRLWPGSSKEQQKR